VKLLKMVAMACVLLMILLSAETVLSADTLKSGDVLIAKATPDVGINELWLLNPLTGDQTLFRNIQQKGYSILHIAVDLHGKDLFTLKVQGQGPQTTGFFPLGLSNISRLEVATGVWQIILDKRNIIDFWLAPDGNALIARYFPPEIKIADQASLTKLQVCVLKLTIPTSKCAPMNLSHGELFLPLWINNHTFAYVSDNQASVNIVNLGSLQTTNIVMPANTSADSLTLMPVTGNILVISPTTGNPDGGAIFVLDPAKGIINQLGEYSGFSVPNVVSVAPDEREVVIAGQNHGNLIDLATGKLVVDYQTAYNMQWTNIQWIPDHTGYYLMCQGWYQGQVILNVLFEPGLSTSFSVLPSLNGEVIVVP
jgi:hypothetical protein